MTRICCAGFLLLVCAASNAQDDASVELSPMQVTSGRVPEAEFEVPQPVTVLTRKQVAERNPQVMAEALRYETGAFFQQTGPGQGMVIVRGLKGSEVLHLVDGMRLNNAFFRTAPSQYVALVDPYNIGQLELLRGPYATLYGSDAMGGVVQVVTPDHRFAEGAWDARGLARVQYATADLARLGRIEGAAGDQNLSLAAGFTYLDYGNRRLAQPGQSPDHQGGVTFAERVEDTAYLGRGYDAKALWTPNGTDELTAAVQYFALPALPRYNETVPGYDTDGAPGAEAAISIYANDRAFYHVRYRRLTQLGFMNAFELHLGQQIVNDDRYDRAADLSRDTREYNRSALTGLTAQAHSMVGEEHRVLYGVELYRDAVRSRAVRETPPGSGAFTSNSAATFPSRFPDGARAADYGAYAMDEWRLAGDWLAEVGARYTYHRTELPQADRLLGATLTDDDFTGSVGLRRALAPSVAWTVNAGRGFRAPNVNDLAQVGRRSNNRVVVANLGLKPESVWSVDSGLKFATESLTAEAGVFQAVYSDRITLVRDAVPEGTGECPDDGDATPEPCAQNRNIARAEYRGVEFGLRYALAEAWKLHTTLNYTWGKQEDGRLTTPANRVPPLNGQLGLEYTWTCLRVEPYFFWADDQGRLDPADRADSRINPAGTGGYGVLNLRASWMLLPWASLQADLRNLLDKAYREHGSGIDGAGFGVAVTAEVRFE
jgi:outer membrane receptor protein involved in Fe transport